MKRREDVIGRTYGRMTVIAEAALNKHLHRRVVCRCACGTERTVDLSSLRTGNTTSCGCAVRERAAALKRSHGHAGKGRTTPTYTSWQAAKLRCTNPTNPRFDSYGGRGITICDRWLHSFENFLADMGERPEGTSLDRIDNDGPYSPENCRWATASQQARNTTAARMIEFNGRTQPLADWADEHGIPPKILSHRLTTYGWDIERALTQPLRKSPKRRA